MTSSKPGLDTQLRNAADRDDGLEKPMVFSAVRRALLGETEPTEDLGKYRVLERLGSGGMGAVFAAWDPELERRVALKVLTGGHEATDEQTLLLREAKAAAQLSHPNIVAVFEVGVARGRVFLAMEYVRGQTLRAWAQTQPSADARLDVLLQAGQGLAAAHARGLVHRDFKPDNVLVDDDGRAKVVDFGLACTSNEAFDSRTDAAHSDEHPPATITQTGSRSGTPDYMAPEQLRGQSADACSDQFAFAVTAWEVLCGQRPFPDNEHPGPPQGRPVAGVPGSVMSALTRALHAEPRRRFASLQLLLEAIDPAPAAARRSRWLLGAAALATAGAIVWGVRARAPVALAPMCTGAATHLEGVWDAPQRLAYASAFAAAAPDVGVSAWTKTEAQLERYASDWVAASTDACEATRIRGEQSDHTFALRNRCLHGRLRSLRALTQRFSDLNPRAVDKALQAARALPPIEACADPDVLGALVEPPPEAIEDQVEGLRDRLASLQAAEALGQYKQVSEAMPALVKDALPLEHRALLAEVKYWEGRTARRMKAAPQAQAALEQAVLHATASGHDRLLAETLGLLAMVVGEERSDTVAGLAIADRARAAIERIGGDAELSAQLASRRGLIHLAAGELQEARTHLLSAQDQFAALSPQEIRLGDTLNNLATVSSRLGQTERAVDEFVRALAILEHHHGPHHPAVASALANLAVQYRTLGRVDDARQAYARALELFTAALGKDHPQVAAVRLNLGNLEFTAGNVDTALALLESAASQLDAALEETHPFIPQAINARGRARIAAGKLESGRADLERAIRLFESTSPESVGLASARCYLGEALAIAGDDAASKSAFEAAFAQFERVLGDAAREHPEATDCRRIQAKVESSK